ncbi:MAG: AAA family ATPase [Candidatus Limnocylindrales bacterium]
MICPTCAATNDAGQKFCGECGSNLASTCPACSASNPPGRKFCGDCGTSLVASGSAAAPLSEVAAPPAPAPTPAPVAERRLVSVLFADLVGFTALSEGRDPEETRDLLSRYFALAREVIARYGGTVEKFIGDAVMAVWGAPVAQEDDAELAVRAGLELVDAVQTLGPAIQARAGVLTGEAAVTLGATNQGMVAGDLVNTASRLQSVAAPGTVLVGEATQRAADRAIDFEPAGPQALKGKAAPVPAFRALRVVAQRGGRGRSDLPEPPFVGRDEELRLLKDTLAVVGRDRRPRLVSVTGPGGIGKSRLAWELEKYVDGVAETIYWHHGRSPASGEGISFWALGEMVRRRARLAETDDEATTRERIAAAVAEYVPGDDDRRWIEPALLTLLGLEPAPPGGRDVLFAAWRTFFERIALKGTTVLVFEDLQWADDGLLDFIGHLLEWSKGAPLLVVTLARPELFDRRPDWGVGTRNFTGVALEPLPDASMRALILGLVPGLPERAVRAIVGRADGVPLYAVEMVRMLVADGRLERVEAGYRAVGDLGDLKVPETLRSLIASRLDRLEPLDRSLVEDGSVLGQSFTLGALVAVSGRDPADVETRLQGLVRRELLELEADPRSPERGQYRFIQSLIREVAHGTLGRPERRARHLAAARYFEALGDEELAGALATHYLAAYEASSAGPEADALAAQARLALRAAAERAAALGAHQQAVAHLEQALIVTTDPAEQALLLERAGASASANGQDEVAEGYLRRAVELHRAAGDRIGTARATAALGRVLVTSRHGDIAVPLLEGAYAEFSDLEGDATLAELGGELARAVWLSGNLRRAIEIADLALRMAEHMDLAPIIADTLVTKGGALTMDGRSAEGLALMRAGQELAERHGLAHTQTRAAINRTALEFRRDPRLALEIGRAGVITARRLGQRNSVVTGNAAGAAIRVGEWAWGAGVLEEALAEDFEAAARAELLAAAIEYDALLGEPTHEMVVEVEQLLAGATDVMRLATLDWAKAWAAFGEGRLADARLHWRQAIAVVSSPEDLPQPARAALWAGDVAAARVDLAELDASGVHGPALEADRMTIRAGIAALEGRTADALALYREALRAWRDLGLAWDEALCGVDMASLLDPAEPEVRTAAEAARVTLVRLGAKPFLARLEAALARPTGRAASPSPPAARPALEVEAAPNQS